jgi:outer membrane protein OmpA-like peptidoglycan-associated protein
VRLSIVALVAAPLAAAVPALAQSNPSTNEIIKSLTPSGNLLQGGTRGIRLVAPNGSPSATEAAPPAHSATTTQSRPARTARATHEPEASPSVNLNVEFATNSANLTPQARHTLDQLGHALNSQELASYRFRIEGHTDTVGSPSFNQALSQRRADAVAAYLEQAFSIPATRLETVGRGEAGLVVPTPPQTPEARNRRVEVINLGT